MLKFILKIFHDREVTSFESRRKVYFISTLLSFIQLVGDILIELYYSYFQTINITDVKRQGSMRDKTDKY